VTPEEHAINRARALLLAHLNPDQRAEYERFGCFHVQGPSGRLYRIFHRWAGNIEIVTKPWGDPMAVLCIHPTEQIPIEDSLLAQKLMIECSEDDLHEIANRAQNPNLSSSPLAYIDRFMGSEQGREHLARSFHCALAIRWILDPRQETAIRYLREALADVLDHDDLGDVLARVPLPDDCEPVQVSDLI